MSAESRLQELGLRLPEVTVPVANYVHAVRTGNLVFLAGKGPLGVAGKVGAEISTEKAYDCAREVGLLLVAVLRQELGSLDRVRRVVKILGFVNSTPDFLEHPKVINGCSDLMVDIFGDRGRHARTALGAGSLPFQIPVEIEAIVEVED
jgi:enamine deaminase RidA (YjgF/YER057c/UK114 family)